MDDAREFVQAQRAKLLEYLDGRAPQTSEEPDALQYVDTVLDAWSHWAEGKVLSPPTDEERTFWFALYQLEELVEDSPQEMLDPYEAVLMQNLTRVRELLRSGDALPEEFYASRPGEVGDPF